MPISHVKSDTIGDMTGTVTVMNSVGSTATVAATDLIRPSDWNSAHNQYLTLSGNTAGQSTISGTNIVLQGGDNITLSATTAAGAATVIISAAAGGAGGTKSGFNPYADLPFVAGQQGQGRLYIEPDEWPNFQCDRMAIPIHITNASNSSGSQTLSYWMGVYSDNAGTLSRFASTSTSIAMTQSGTVGSYSLHSGMRLVTIPYTTTFTEGVYWIAQATRTTSGGANATISQILISQLNSNFLGHFGSSHNTTMQYTKGQGVYTVTTSGMPASIGFNQIRGSDSMAFRAPVMGFYSGTN